MTNPILWMILGKLNFLVKLLYLCKVEKYYIEYPSKEDYICMSKMKTMNMDNKIKLLILDDDEISRYYVSYVYKKTAIVDAVEDAESAIKKASEIVYDIILLDIGLRGKLNGIDVLKEMRKLPEYDKVPMIAFTAFAMAGDREKFLSEGFDDYISKPFTKEELFSLIDKNLLKQHGEANQQ
jgi:CheY-like chemotaxis protein